MLLSRIASSQCLPLVLLCRDMFGHAWSRLVVLHHALASYFSGVFQCPVCRFARHWSYCCTPWSCSLMHHRALTARSVMLLNCAPWSYYVALLSRASRSRFSVCSKAVLPVRAACFP